MFKHLWPGSVCISKLLKRNSSIYMFICTELIEETGRAPGLILACGNISDKIEFGKIFTYLTEL